MSSGTTTPVQSAPRGISNEGVHLNPWSSRAPILQSDRVSSHTPALIIWRNLLIVGFRSVHEILDLSGVRSKVGLNKFLHAKWQQQWRNNIHNNSSKFSQPWDSGDQHRENQDENKSLYPDCVLVIQVLLTLSFWNGNHKNSVWPVRQLARLKTFL